MVRDSRNEKLTIEIILKNLKRTKVINRKKHLKYCLNNDNESRFYVLYGEGQLKHIRTIKLTQSQTTELFVRKMRAS